MEKFRVYAVMDEKEYGLAFFTYDDDRDSRWELIKGPQTIYRGLEEANFAISEHKRTRADQKVDEYKLVTVLN